jgi:hypothetical protein
LKYVLGLVGVAVAVAVGMQGSRAFSDHQKFTRWEALCKEKERGRVVSGEGKHTCFFYEAGELRVSRFDSDR